MTRVAEWGHRRRASLPRRGRRPEPAAGLAVGWVAGWLLGRLFFRAPSERFRLAEHAEGFVALAATFLAYGAGELVHGYGFHGPAAAEGARGRDGRARLRPSRRPAEAA